MMVVSVETGYASGRPSQGSRSAARPAPPRRRRRAPRLVHRIRRRPDTALRGRGRPGARWQRLAGALFVGRDLMAAALAAERPRTVTVPSISREAKEIPPTPVYVRTISDQATFGKRPKMVEFGMREAADGRVEQYRQAAVRAAGRPSAGRTAGGGSGDARQRRRRRRGRAEGRAARRRPRTRRAGRRSRSQTLFGLYEGVPLVERGQGYTLVLPDKITIFADRWSESFRSPQALMREVRITVVHELGHHLGFDEDRLEELGWA